MSHPDQAAMSRDACDSDACDSKLGKPISKVDYDHNRNLHTISGAKAALKRFFGERPPQSLLDVGSGTGTWLRAALDLGVNEIYGVDGVPIEADALLIPRQFFRVEDLSQRIDLGRKFDIVLCLEVAEHLPADTAPRLIATLVAHSDVILFSAAAIGQQGQHHVNCQWPRYWQDLFNAHGYTCDDDLRWQIWDLHNIEPWYRQNIFTAKHAPQMAGKEARLKAVIHPDMVGASESHRSVMIRQIECGSESVSWYLSILPRALAAKLPRRITRLRENKSQYL
jgi:SAM-dependent methyltransferase